MVNETVEGFDFEDELVNDDAIFESGFDEELHHSASTAGLDDLTADHRSLLARAAERGREQLYDIADRGKGRLADAIERGVDELDDRLGHTAHYLRTHDVEVIRDDLIQQVRRHPFLSVGIAVGTGYLIGKALGANTSRGVRGRLRTMAGHQLRRALIAGLVAAAAAGTKRDGSDGSDEEGP